uniref:Putative catalytic domain of testis-specific serine/threonine kinase n=1 Tax=Panstrongylus lignarius TaxID=156445 RepID=A0A224XK49_9HEMI
MRPWQEAENVPTISQDSCNVTTCNVTKINGIFGETIQNILLKKGYKLGKTIGEGSYCKVKIAYRASELGFVEKIACKIVNKKKASRDFVTKFLPREVSIVRSIRHPNIVSVCDIIESEDLVYIFMDICERGDLLDYIRARGPLSEARTKFFFRQMVEAISYLHNRDIAHRDLKCENVLLAGRDHLKIADFGFARWCSDISTKKRILSETYCGSAAYAAPEILQGVKYNPKMYDIWSLGVILFIMISAAMPFDDGNISRLIKAQMNKKFSFPEKICVSSKVKRLVSHLLEPDVTKRATIKQVANYAWLDDRCYSGSLLRI